MSGTFKLSFLGAAGTVTGSSHLVNTGVGKVMIDCGMFQGPREIEQRNFLGFGVNPADVDYLVLTHAHIDHIGLVPRFVKLGFHGDIWCTRATRDLAEILLLDSAHIQEHDAAFSKKRGVERDSVQNTPLYTADDVTAAMRRFKTAEYEAPAAISRYLTARFRDAGHILGSASVELAIRTAEGGARLVGSGDIGQRDSVILEDPRPFERADYLLIESTYGDRLHEDLADRKKLFADEIERMLEHGSPLIVPAFAVGRTQQLLYLLSELRKENTRWEDFPVYVDSPLAEKATAIVEAHPECFDKELAAMLGRGMNPFHAPWLHFTESVEESKALNMGKGPRMIISASGMCNAGRIRHHLANNLANKNATVLFVGYQGVGTLGRILLEGAHDVTLFGERVPVHARISEIRGFSAHADQKGLLDWLDAMEEKPGKVFIVHGEEAAATVLRDKIRERGIDAHIAEEDETLTLPFTQSVAVGAATKSGAEPGLEGAPRTAPVQVVTKIKEAPGVGAPPIAAPEPVGAAGAFVLPGPQHPGDSAKNRVTRYLRWLAKEVNDARFVVDEIAAELPGWLSDPSLPLPPAQSVGVVYDDVISEVLPLLVQTLKSYEAQLRKTAKTGQGSSGAGPAADEVLELTVALEELVKKHKKATFNILGG